MLGLLKTIVIASLMVVSCNLFAQETESKSKEIDNVDAFFSSIKGDTSALKVSSVMPTKMPGMKVDIVTQEAFNQAMQEFYAYRSAGYKHRSLVFEWQLFSSKIIFYVVVFLVIIGLFFSGVQFYAAYKNNFVETKSTEISASTSGLKVSSSVLGVIILVISLLFFYLYLVYVYPINEIF